MIHILVGQEAASKLKESFELEGEDHQELKGEVLVLRDTLGIGPLQSDGNFDAMRTEFWKRIHPSFSEEVDDESKLIEAIAQAVANEEELWFWMAPCVSDVAAYYYLLQHCREHDGLLHVININGLPFMNEKNALYYPTNFSEILPKEFRKARKLLKKITPADYETDGDDWQAMCDANTMVRTHTGGKELSNENEAYFDQEIINCVSGAFQKENKIVRTALKLIEQSVSDLYIRWRLKEMAASGQLELNDAGEYKREGGKVDAPETENAEG